MPGFLRIRVWDVEHGCCVMLQHTSQTLGGPVAGRLAMIDSGSSADFRPSRYIRQGLGRDKLDYLFITNADQDHMSDLKGLSDAGITVRALYKNPSYTADQIRAIKRQSGPLTDDASWYADACGIYTEPLSEPFGTHMGGVTCRTFWNKYPAFTDTNNLSLVVFIKYQGFKMLFPGDLEKAGWLALLQDPEFRAELKGTDVLMASHHGRENGFCGDIFGYFTPSCVVISDKPIVHETQLGTTHDYRYNTSDKGVIVRTSGKQRHVLTTRRDGWINFDVGNDGSYVIDTEHIG